jgi:hypothetical protein
MTEEELLLSSWFLKLGKPTSLHQSEKCPKGRKTPLLGVGGMSSHGIQWKVAQGFEIMRRELSKAAALGQRVVRISIYFDFRLQVASSHLTRSSMNFSAIHSWS